MLTRVPAIPVGPGTLCGRFGAVARAPGLAPVRPLCRSRQQRACFSHPSTSSPPPSDSLLRHDSPRYYAICPLRPSLKLPSAVPAEPSLEERSQTCSALAKRLYLK